MFHHSVLVGLRRTPLCSFLSLVYSGAQLLYYVFRVQDDFSAFLSQGDHALWLPLASPSPHLEEPSAFTKALITSAPTSIPGVRRGAPLGDTRLFVSAGLPPVPATRAGDLSKEFLCTVLGDGNDMKRKPRRVACHASGRNSVETPKPASRHIASLSPCESWVVDLSPSQRK